MDKGMPDRNRKYGKSRNGPETEALLSPTKKQVLNYGELRNRQDSASPGRWLRNSAQKAGLSP